MNDSSRCELCGQVLPGGADRCCGLDLCPPCLAGEVEARVAGRGFVFTTERWVVQSRDDNRGDMHHTRVTGTVATSLRPQARFTRETTGDRVRRFFGRHELQAGDRLFDQSIWVETSTPDATAALLGVVGVHDVILEAVAELGELRFESNEGGASIVAHTAWSSNASTPEPTSHARVIACGLHYLQRAFPR